MTGIAELASTIAPRGPMSHLQMQRSTAPDHVAVKLTAYEKFAEWRSV
jgi:hypothetical protein